MESANVKTQSLAVLVPGDRPVIGIWRAAGGFTGSVRPARRRQNSGSHEVNPCALARGGTPPLPCLERWRRVAAWCRLDSNNDEAAGTLTRRPLLVGRDHPAWRSKPDHPTASATRSMLRAVMRRSRRMKRERLVAGTRAWRAIRRRGRPSRMTAARRVSESAVVRGITWTPFPTATRQTMPERQH